MSNKLKSVFLGLGVMWLLTGCEHLIVLNPKGAVGAEERDLILTAIGLMLIVVIPVIIMAFVFAYKYRESNPNLDYDPEFHHSNKIEVVVWAIPIVIIAILATITWRTTHSLDPYKPLNEPGKPITIQVVALDWKWLFIYPEQNIASVNLVEFPVDRPVEFRLTSDAPMNAFQIPQLGGQIYAMAGMQTKLHLIANEAGDYFGRAVNISGRGFSGMQFVARAVPQAEFDSWVSKVKQSPDNLSANEYYQLVKPSEDDPVKLYASVQPNLFNNIIMKFMMPGMEDLSVDHGSMMQMAH